MKAYYNEFDKKKCAALSQLMKDGYITKGDIDDRSIRDVRPEDVKGYDRAHFFAGIGLWDYALQLAGWEDQPVWTGSCPCQPFSTAGRQKGKADDRHLWPEWLRLIEKCKPPTIFGEQVASAITKGWLDDVYQGLEAQDYAVGSAVLPASSVGAPHRRERLWFVADMQSEQCNERQDRNSFTQCGKEGLQREVGASSSSMGNTNSINRGLSEREKWEEMPETLRTSSTLANSKCERSQGQRELRRSVYSKENSEGQTSWSDNDSSRHWQNGVWIDCPDGKQRLVEPRIPLLAHGYPEKVGIIHCAGDAIVSALAAEFIKAVMEIKNDLFSI